MRIRAEYPGPDQDVLSLVRPFKCYTSPCCCLLQEMTIIKLANDHEQDQRTLGMLQARNILVATMRLEFSAPPFRKTLAFSTQAL